METNISTKPNSFCQSFAEDVNLRQLVLGTAQLCLDLCASLNLPVNVAAASLLCLQRFLDEFDARTLERPLLCGACVLLSWKYWEDFKDIRSVRKLNDICRELFQLLLSSPDNEDTVIKSNTELNKELRRESKRSRLRALLKTSPIKDEDVGKRLRMKMSADEKNDILQDITIQDNNSLALKLTASTLKKQQLHSKQNGFKLLTLDDEKIRRDLNGRELTNCNGEGRWKVDEWETADWTWGATNGKLSATDWTLRDDGREFIRVKEKIKIYESCLLRCLDFEVGPVELPFEVVDGLCRYLWTEEIKRRRIQDSIYKAKRSNTGSIPNHTSTNSIPNYAIDSCVTQQNSGEPVLHNRNNQEEEFQLLNDLLELSSGFALDFFRAPFCLLSSGAQIGIAAVWKAAIALEFSCLFQGGVTALLTPGSISAECETYLEAEQKLQDNLFNIPIPIFKRLLQQFRVLYEWLADFEEAKLQLSTPSSSKNPLENPSVIQHSQ